jgi:hypothetical protein
MVMVMIAAGRGNIQLRADSLLTRHSKHFCEIYGQKGNAYLNSKSILVNKQYGFMKDLSTNKATFKLIH